jgi:dTDP-4-dehydrorhamnose 3,5-epimerase
MAYEKLALPELILFIPKVIEDEYGINFDSFSMFEFAEAVGLNYSFVQDNQSKSIKGVLRGLHYQLPPHLQGKLVRVVQGAVFDVAVDIRKSSPNFGKWVGAILSEDNNQPLWIPTGFAPDFVTLTNTAEFLYKTTDFYAPQFECCIAWDDPSVGVYWHYSEIPQLSTKDLQGAALSNAEVFQ